MKKLEEREWSPEEEQAFKAAVRRTSGMTIHQADQQIWNAALQYAFTTIRCDHRHRSTSRGEVG